MPKLDFAFLAGRVLKDELSGKFSFLDIFGSFTIPANESYITQFFTVAGRISNALAGTPKIKVSIVDGKGELVEGGVVELSGPVQPGELLIGANFAFVKFKQEGKHFIHLEYDGKEIEGGKGEWFFDVLKAK